ncbi:MAG: hypothetical protein QHC40_13450 [Sphingobium sp.]|nr:hypothetical protein [Sphingobium sp.]
MRKFAPLIPIALLASCVAAPEQRPAPPPASRPAPAPAPAPPPTPAPTPTEWQYRPVTPGDWRYRGDAGGSSAVFGMGASAPLLAIRCDRATRRVSFALAGAGSGPMLVRTTYGATNWPATATSAALPETVATRAAADVVLDQIAYSRGKFGVEVQGLAPLILPAWAEVARVVEDCRG